MNKEVAVVKQQQKCRDGISLESSNLVSESRARDKYVDKDGKALESQSNPNCCSLK